MKFLMIHLAGDIFHDASRVNGSKIDFKTVYRSVKYRTAPCHGLQLVPNPTFLYSKLISETEFYRLHERWVSTLSLTSNSLCFPYVLSLIVIISPTVKAEDKKIMQLY